MTKEDELNWDSMRDYWQRSMKENIQIANYLLDILKELHPLKTV